jgi:hypothetical protein
VVQYVLHVLFGGYVANHSLGRQNPEVEEPVQITGYGVDVTSEQAVQNAFNAIMQLWGRIDVVVPAAGESEHPPHGGCTATGLMGRLCARQASWRTIPPCHTPQIASKSCLTSMCMELSIALVRLQDT